jgi:tetratricopeptide (TPR) repeat protein
LPGGAKPREGVETLPGFPYRCQAATLAGLVHPAIVRYVAHGITTEGEPYIAMEWLDGETLADRIARGPVEPEAIARLGSRILQALAAAHACGIVHRDVKPSNIFLAGGDLGQAKLLDFGIARRAHDVWQITRPDGGMGTPMYMPPEQFRDGSKVDGRADVFSLGCVLYESSIGEPPRLAVQGHDPTFVWQDGTLERLRRSAPPPLADILARMLALSLDDRPADLDRLSCELSQVADEVKAAGAHACESCKSLGLSSAEQRIATVVVASGMAPEGWQAARFATLAAALVAHGARVERTGPETWAIVLATCAVPGDLAAQAARWALQAKAELASVSLAVSTSLAGRDDPRALAEAVQQADRMASAATNTVVVDERVARLLEGRFELQSLTEGSFALCAEQPSGEVPRTLMGKDVPCFGREREISFVEDLWQEVCESSAARVLVLSAPAGGGKSRVRHEACQRIRREGKPFAFLLGRGDPMRDSAPFAMLGPAILEFAGIAGDEPAPVQHERLAAGVARLLPGDRARQTAAFLGEIANLSFPDDELPALRAARKDAHLMSDQRQMAWLEWLEAECAREPVLLVLEDLHWADAPSVAFVDAALRLLADKRLFVLALARPEVDRRFPSLWPARNPHRIALSPLSAPASKQMIGHVAGELPEARARWIVDRAEGNPFYLQELLRVVVEGGKAGRKAEDDSNLPDTVLGMVQARLDGFGPDAKLVLRAASVYGESFFAAGVRALLDDEHRKDVDRWLDILEEQEVVFRRHLGDRREYAFRHALLRQAAYESLPAEEKRLGHLLAGRFLEGAGEKDGSVVADHFERAGEKAAAVKWLVVAARQALEANDIAEAVARAVGAVGEELCGLKLVEARAWYWKGEYRRAEEAAKAALGTKDERTKLLALEALFDGLGPQAKYREIAERYPVDKPNEPELLNAWLEAMCAGAAFLAAGIAPEYLDRMLELLAQYEDRLDPVLLGRRALLTHCAWRANGKLMKGIACGRSAANRFRSVGLQLDAFVALGNVAVTLSEAGRLDEAIAEIQKVLEFALKWDLKHLQSGGFAALATCNAYLGRFDEARASGRQAQAIARAQSDRRFQGTAEMYLSMTELLSGCHTAAERFALDAMATLEAVPFSRPFAVALLARALAAQGRAAEALPRARDAYAQLEKMGGVDDGEATIRLALAECLIANGDRDAARNAVASAAEWLRCRADKLDHPGYRESFLTRIPEHRRILELAHDFGV